MQHRSRVNYRQSGVLDRQSSVQDPMPRYEES